MTAITVPLQQPSADDVDLCELDSAACSPTMGDAAGTCPLGHEVVMRVCSAHAWTDVSCPDCWAVHLPILVRLAPVDASSLADR